MAQWSNYNLPAIWSMIDTENACTGADRVLAWQNLSQAVREQHRRLLAAKEDLAAAWPPQSNDSARKFLSYIDQLASSMQETLTCGENTRVGLQGVIEAIGTAQTTVRPLLEERAGVADDLIPRFVDHAEDEYDEKAQRAMQAAEKAVAEHSAQIQSPTPFNLGADVGDGQEIGNEPSNPPQGGHNAGRSGLRATPVSVPVPHDPPDIHGMPNDPSVTGGGPGSGTGTGGGPAVEGGVGSGVGGPAGSGVDLAGVSTPAPPAAPPISTPLGGPLQVPLGGSGSPGMVIGGGALGLNAGMPLVGPSGFRSGTPVNRQPVPVRSAMASGTVIGATQPGVRGAPGQMMPAQAGRNNGGASEEEAVPMGEADQLWAVDSGVDPVIVPESAPTRSDPGPGVIGRTW